MSQQAEKHVAICGLGAVKIASAGSQEFAANVGLWRVKKKNILTFFRC
jgi:hypothetical protein